MLKILKGIFNFVASIRLSIILMLYGGILVFLGTLEQVNLGIDVVQAKYFESFFLVSSWGIPLVGGFSIGILLFLNLSFSMVKYAKLSYRGVMFILAHLSLLLLVASGFMQYYLRQEASLILYEGQTKHSLEVYEKGVTLPKETIDIDFGVKLLKFEAQTWDSSNIHKEFSSRVEILERDGDKVKATEYLISMNKPLSFGGWTFYQNNYGKDGYGRNMSVLSAVKNPWKELSWISVVSAFVAMALLYIQKLFKKKNAPAIQAKSPEIQPKTLDDIRAELPKSQPRKTKIIVAISVLLCVFLLSKNFIFEKFSTSEFDYSTIESLPVLKGGRTMPLSSAANDATRGIGGKITVKAPEKMTATQWLIMLNAGCPDALAAKIFRTDSRDLQSILGVSDRYYGIKELQINFEKISSIANSKDNSPLNKAAIEAVNNFYHFMLLKDMFAFSIDSNKAEFRTQWRESIAMALKEYESAQLERRELKEEFLLPANTYLQLLNERSEIEGYYNDSLIRISFKDSTAYTANEELLNREAPILLEKSFLNMAKFLDALRDKNYALAAHYQAELMANTNQTFRIKFENFYNKLDAFFAGMIMFVVAFISFLLGIAFPKKAKYFNSVGYVFFSFALLSSTFAMFARCYIQMRPPVTNLYSSIVFSGWASTVFAFAYGLFKKKELYLLAGALVGFICLLVAMNLPYSGDSMGMMRAVLNSNFWLTSHVVTIMIGYCAIFLAGAIALMRLVIVAVSGGNTPALETKETASSIYGILSLGLLFTFLGTTLGGVWADMSWGRFWGWDPKENGALIIILYLAACLHARIFKLISDRAFLALSVFANIVTAWAWFGVNMLGIGLHAYGFFDSNWSYLILFVISQLVCMSLALVKEKS